MPFQNAIVVGASAGIGEAITRKLAAGGARVAALSRRQAELDRVAAGDPRIVPYVHDVRDVAAAPVLFQRIVQDFGSVDLVVYNAGVMPRVAADEYDFEKDRAMVEVNLLGAMAWLNPAAAYMAGRKQGTLCGISSVAGDRGRSVTPAYHSTKGALTIYLESLRNRLDRQGVAVVTVKPGPVRTAMSEGLKLPFLISPEACADGAVALMEAGTGSGYVPKLWGPIMLAIVHTPSVIFRRLNI